MSSPIINKLASIGNYILAAGSKGIYYSLTDGENWSMANGIDSWVKDLFVFGNLVFAGTFDGMYKSSDSGKTWQLITNGLPLDQPIWSITSIGSTLFALHRSLDTYITSLFMSTDTGKTWLPIEPNPPLPYLTYSILAIDSILFAKTDIPKYNLIVSTDYGKTWSPAEFPGQGFAIYNSILYSTNGYGIFYSTDCVITWEDLKEENLRDICSIVGFSEDKIFLGILVDGRMRVKIPSPPLSVNETNEKGLLEIKSEGLVLYLYPEALKISFEIKKSSYVKIKVFNILGNEVGTLLSEELAPGRYTREWETRELGKGVYLIQLKTQEEMKISKLLIIK